MRSVRVSQSKIVFEGINECACNEHPVLYGSFRSIYCTPEMNITLY